MARSGLFYVRFMDDILAPTRWRLRRAVKAVNQAFAALQLEKHPDKTFTLGSSPRARIERGFDFLGYHFSPAGIAVARHTIARFVEHAARLYEQEPEEALASTRLGLYVRR